jgi:hypothetical protein
MHPIKNISERNKIDTQSRADTYIRRKRLISKSEKVFVKLKKNLKTLSSGQKKNKKKNKKTHWAGFFFKTRVFSNPG